MPGGELIIVRTLKGAGRVDYTDGQTRTGCGLLRDTMKADQRLAAHRKALLQCTLCPDMVRPVVAGPAVASSVLLVGQAPGDKEGRLGKPFAWTAGKTLFRWFETIGVDEQQFRERVYMAAVCRCFPGKKPAGGDRVPNTVEVANCGRWLEAEIELLRPGLVIPVGKLAISQFVPLERLVDVIGRAARVERAGHAMDAIPLPHPSGASTWHQRDPGKHLLEQALTLIAQHPTWRSLGNRHGEGIGPRVNGPVSQP